MRGPVGMGGQRGALDMLKKIKRNDGTPRNTNLGENNA